VVAEEGAAATAGAAVGGALVVGAGVGAGAATAFFGLFFFLLLPGEFLVVALTAVLRLTATGFALRTLFAGALTVFDLPPRAFEAAPFEPLCLEAEPPAFASAAADGYPDPTATTAAISKRSAMPHREEERAERRSGGDRSEYTLSLSEVSASGIPPDAYARTPVQRELAPIGVGGRVALLALRRRHDARIAALGLDELLVVVELLGRYETGRHLLKGIDRVDRVLALAARRLAVKALLVDAERPPAALSIGEDVGVAVLALRPLVCGEAQEGLGLDHRHLGLVALSAEVTHEVRCGV
jgi:hypothetical protein